MSKILNTALSQYGIREWKQGDNPDILKYFDDPSKFRDETAWCSAFVNWVCKKAGKLYSGKLNARSWLDVGDPIQEPQMGDIVVLWRERPDSWKGHVGFYIRETTSYIYILGGNQSNQVRISAYPKSRLLQYRRV